MAYIYRALVVVMFVASIFVGYSIVVQTPPKDVVIKIEVAPSVASVTIDGKRAKVGENKVVAGKHIVSASLDKFSTQSQTFSTHPGDSLYAGFVLQPDDDQVRDWYSKYPDDQQLAEGISSHMSDYVSDKASEENSILQELPYSYGDGHGGLVTISQGVPVKGSSKQAIYVDASTPNDRQEALEWIRTSGYNLADMDIVFSAQLDGYLVQKEGGE